MMSFIQKTTLFLSLIFIFNACGGNSSLEETPVEPPERIPTSESQIENFAPLILVESVGENGTVFTNSVLLKGKIISQTSIQSFYYAVNGSNPIDTLTSLNENLKFEIQLENLNEGENQITLSLTDDQNQTSEHSLTITYSLATEPEPTPTLTWDDMADILNNAHAGLNAFLNTLQFLENHEQAVNDYLDFFATWDGEVESLQEFWNTWANAELEATPQSSEPVYNNTPNAWNLEDLSIAITDINSITDAVFDELPFDVPTLNQNIVARENIKQLMWCDFLWAMTITETTTDLNLERHQITNITFLDNYRLKVELAADNAVQTNDYEFTGTPQDCRLSNDTQTRHGTLTTEGLSGTFIFGFNLFSFDDGTHVLSLMSVDTENLSVDHVENEIEDTTGFWTNIKEWFVRNRWGCVACSREEKEIAFIQYVFDLPETNDPNFFLNFYNDSLNENPAMAIALQNLLQPLFNITMNFSGELPVENSTWTYTADMTDFVTTPLFNRLISTWDLNIDTNENQNTCGTHLDIPNFLNLGEASFHNLGDLTLELSFNNIARSIQGLARTGAFCFTETLTFEDFEMAQLAFIPYGTLDIQPSTTANAHLDVIIPFRAQVSFGDELLNYENTHNNIVTGLLTLAVKFDSDCRSGVTLSVENIAVANLEGTLQINSYTFDVSELSEEIQTALENFDTSALQDITLMPKVMALDELENVALQIEDEFVVSGGNVNLGMTLVPADECETTSQQNTSTPVGTVQQNPTARLPANHLPF